MSDFCNDDNEISVYNDKIDMYISLFKEENNIDCFKSQMVWDACLMYIYRNVFKPDHNLRDNRKCIIPYSDMDTIFKVLDIYTYYCNINERMTSIDGFCIMTGISDDTVYRNASGNSELSRQWKVLLKRLHGSKQSAIDSKLFDSNNVTGQLALANHYFGYNLPGVSKEVSRDSIATSQLPSFSIECNNDPNE